MAQIRIDTEHAREAGRRLISESDRLAEIGHELQDAISSLDIRAWDGVSRARAEPMLGRVRPESERMAQGLDILGRKLVRVADVFEQEDNTAARNLEGMPWVSFETTRALSNIPGLNQYPSAGTAALGAFALSELPITGHDVGGLIGALYKIVPIEMKITQFKKLNEEIEDLQQRMHNLPPASGLAVVTLAVMRIIMQRKMALRDALKEAIAADPAPLVYKAPGSNIWTEEKVDSCVIYAKRRTGKDIAGNAKDIPKNYPNSTVTLDGTEEDLRYHIKPGMLMVWQPPRQPGAPGPDDFMYGVNYLQNGQQDYAVPPPGDYYDDIRWADETNGHVAVVEEVGPDYIVVSDQHGQHHIDKAVRYRRNGYHEDDFLTGRTFVDLPE